MKPFLACWITALGLLSSTSLAQQPCAGIPGVEVTVSPAVAGLGQEIKVTLTNNSTQLIQLSSSCSFKTVFFDVCGAVPVFSPFCLSVITPILPGTSATTSWLQTDNSGNQVPPGRYAFDVSYFDGAFSSFSCCPTVTVCSSPPTQASETARLGTPPNPSAFLPGVSGGPVVGTTWDPVVDHTTFQPAALLDFAGISGISTNIPSGFGTILCGTAPALVVTATAGTPFSIPVPADCGFVGAALCAQGGSIDGVGTIELANALDFIIGTI